MVVSYALSIPIIFVLMHFMQFPGNIEGDFKIAGTRNSDFTASRSDGKLLRAHSVTVPVPANSKQAPMIFFGGNAQGMSGAAEDALWLLGDVYHNTTSYQFQLFTTAYRGYAPNDGFVTQSGLTKDAEDFLDHVLNVTDAGSDGRVLLGGWSMGCGVALQLAAARPEKIAGVIVFSPWSTLRTESLHIAAPLTYLVYPWIWLSQTWDSVAAIASLPADIPVAVLSAGHDLVIKSFQHRTIYEASKASKKWWLPTSNAGHPDLNYEVTQHLEDILQWMEAAWARVHHFVPGEPSSSLTANFTITHGDGRAFDVLSDTFARVHEFFVV